MYFNIHVSNPYMRVTIMWVFSQLLCYYRQSDKMKQRYLDKRQKSVSKTEVDGVNIEKFKG